MNYPIIQLSSSRIEEGDFLTEDLLFDDDTINDNSDYLNGNYTKGERKEFIKEHLPRIFKGIATVDAENETLTILDEKTVARTVRADLRRKKDEMNKRFKEDLLTSYHFRRAGKWFRDDENIINLDGASYVSALFMESCISFAGQTFHIGGIISAHF